MITQDTDLFTATDHMTTITIVAGSIGFVGATILSLGAAKAIMAYYKKLRRQ